MKAVKMSEGIYRVGANIKNGDMFEGMWPIPDGVSLNCYVVEGEKKALIDMVDDWNNAPGQIREQLSSISMGILLKCIRNFIMNNKFHFRNINSSRSQITCY